MTKEQIIEVMDSLGEDVTYFDCGDILHVTLEDFAGFDEDWNEIERDYDNPEAVDEFLAILEEYGRPYTSGLYPSYDFDGFKIELSWASFDI